MDKKEERNKKILAVTLVIAVLALIVYQIFFANKNDDEKIDTEKITIVTNQNDFYTVSSCISKYFSYLTAKDKEKILVLLSDQYKKDNTINIDNLDNFVTYLNDIYSFNPRKMYVQRLSKEVYKFYVYGWLVKESMISSEMSDYYIVVLLDRGNLTFAIEPYNGDLFK